MNQEHGAQTPSEIILDVQGLTTEIDTSNGSVRPVDGVSFALRRGKATALVGESGSGKSVTALSIMRLVRHPCRIIGGKVLLEGRDLLELSEHQMQHIRGSEIAMVFQDPMTFLNPVFRVGEQLMEAVLLHQPVSRADAKGLVLEVLKAVRIASPETVFEAFPHQLSGGMRQRVLIAMAISCKPKVIIADEPTTALDVTVQAQIMELLKDLVREFNLALLLITHDLGLVAGYCDDLTVMYAGRVAETGTVFECFATPRHPYTRALIDCSLRPDQPVSRFNFIPGQVSDLRNPPTGCRFNPRCACALPICAAKQPELKQIGSHKAACWLNESGAESSQARPSHVSSARFSA